MLKLKESKFDSYPIPIINSVFCLLYSCTVILLSEIVPGLKNNECFFFLEILNITVLHTEDYHAVGCWPIGELLTLMSNNKLQVNYILTLNAYFLTGLFSQFVFFVFPYIKYFGESVLI